MASNLQMIQEAAAEHGVSYESILDKPLQPGELYLAHRNGPVKLLTCHKDDRENCWVLPDGMGYPYDTHECFRVIQ